MDILEKDDISYHTETVSSYTMNCGKPCMLFIHSKQKRLNVTNLD